MKQIKHLVLLVFVAFLAACKTGNNNVVLDYTTDKTLGVTRINLNSLAEKIGAEKLLQEKQNIDEEQKTILQLAANPNESGVDVSKPLFVIVDPGKKAYNPQVHILFAISDKEKFQTHMSKFTKETVKIDDKSLMYVDDKLVGSLKDGYAVMLVEEEERNYSYDDAKQPEATVTVEKLDAFWARKGDAKASIKEQVNNALVDNKDLSAWVNVESVSVYLSQGYIESLAVFKLLADAGISANFNFDNGKMELETTTYFNKDLKEVVAKYYSKNSVNYDLSKYVNIENASAYSFSYLSVDLVKYFIKQAGFESTVNNMLSESNTNIEELSSLFTGDFAVAEQKPSDEAYYYRNNQIVIVGIQKDKQSIIDKFVEFYDVDSSIFAIGENEILFSEDSTTLAQFRNKVEAENSSLNRVSGVNTYSWANGAALFNAYLNSSDNPQNINIVDIISESKETSGDLTMKMTVNFDKKDANVIYYLLKHE